MRPTTPAPPNITTLGELVERYHRHNTTMRRTKATHAWHELSLSKFVEFMGGPSVPLTDLEEMDTLEDYLEDLSAQAGLRTISINTYLRSLRAFLRWAIAEKRLRSAPPVVFLDAEDAEAYKAILTQHDFCKLREAARQEESEVMQLRAEAILLMLYTTGLRVSELVKARWLDIECKEQDGHAAYILTIAGAKKSGKRDIVLLDEVWAAINRYRQELAHPQSYYYSTPSTDPAWLFVSGKNPDEALSVRGLQSFCVRLGKRAGVHCNPHSFRHTAATNMGNSGATLQEMMWYFGWKTPRMALHYCQKKQETVIRTARRYNPLPSAQAELDRARERARRMRE